MISIIVPWCDRKEILEAVPRFLSCVDALGGEVLIVNYSGDQAFLDNHLPYHQRLRVIQTEQKMYFNKSAAQNIGAAHSAYDVLFFCDCDILIKNSIVQEIVEHLVSAEEMFATVAGVKETTINARGAGHITRFGYTLRLKTSDGANLEIIDNEEDGDDGTRQAPGLLFLNKKHFFAVNGYNSQLLGWGWEDQDMIARLSLGARLQRYTHGILSHISHGDSSRMARYPEFSSRWESRDRMFRQALANYDQANFRGTYSHDIKNIESWEHRDMN